MATFMRSLKMVIVGLVLVGIGSMFVKYYSYIFSRRVVGVIVSAERVQLNIALMQTSGAPNEKLNSELYSFAVGIKEKTGEIVTASAEDRQWAVAQPGQCAEAVYYPYPPWEFSKANTYFGARLEKLSDCQ